MGSVNKIIKSCPGFLKRAYYNCVPFNRRYGKIFVETFQNLMTARTWNKQQLLDYQYLEFKKLITHCYNNVPYYKNVMLERGLSPQSFKSASDISLLPILTKDIIRDNTKDLIASNMIRQKCFEFRTSGSTGKKLIFYGTDDLYKKEAAFVLRAFNDHDATMYDKPSVWLRRFVPPKENMLWNYDYELRRLYMSAYHVNDKTVYDYVKKINAGNYHTLVGYPSSIYILACLCEDHNLSLKISQIHVASEKMLEEWSNKIYKVFGIKPKAHYGLQEKVVFHHQTSESDHYYENFEYGITEFVQENNQNVIVGTGFNNYYMPFLRYKTNDVGIINNDKSTCYTMLDIDGRCDDILISKDGCRLPGVNFYTMMYKIDGVKMFQIFQKADRSLTMNIVKNEKFCEKTETEIRKGMSSRVGSLPLNITIVDEIKRSTETGKIRNIFTEK